MCRALRRIRFAHRRGARRRGALRARRSARAGRAVAFRAGTCSARRRSPGRAAERSRSVRCGGEVRCRAVAWLEAASGSGAARRTADTTRRSHHADPEREEYEDCEAVSPIEQELTQASGLRRTPCTLLHVRRVPTDAAFWRGLRLHSPLPLPGSTTDPCFQLLRQPQRGQLRQLRATFPFPFAHAWLRCHAH